jgi:hypothetical protein
VLTRVRKAVRSTVSLRPNKRLPRKPSKVSVLVRARDAAGNVTEKTVTIRVLR